MINCFDKTQFIVKLSLSIFDLPRFILVTFQKNLIKIICQVNASDVIILEGILVFHDQRVRNLMDMKIFVDTGLIPFIWLSIIIFIISFVFCHCHLSILLLELNFLREAFLLQSPCCYIFVYESKLCLVLEFNVSLSPNQLRYLGNSRVDWEVYMLLVQAMQSQVDHYLQALGVCLAFGWTRILSFLLTILREAF